MLPGLRGSLVSEHFLEEDLPRLFAGGIGESTRASASRQARHWWRIVAGTMGPASSLRSIIDCAALPLAGILGFTAGEPAVLVDQPITAIALSGPARAAATLIVTTWSADLDAVWRTTVRLGASAHTPWCLCFNATHLRLVDAGRTFARRFLEFDLGTSLAHPDTFTALWALLRAEAFAIPGTHAPGPPGVPVPPPLIDRIVELSAERGVGVCASLKQGVLEALVDLAQGFVAGDGGGRPGAVGQRRLFAVLEQSLTIVYRILFLPVRRGAGPPAGVAPDLQGELRDRDAQVAGGGPSARPGALGGVAGDLAPGARGVPGRRSSRHAVQRPALLAAPDAARRALRPG